MKNVRPFTPLFTAALLFLAACSHRPDRRQFSFTGAIKAGERFESQFGQFVLVLEPGEFGWVVALYERGRNENLARLTPPSHFVPNPTQIEGWHFRNEDNTGPNDGSVNAPQGEREFIFSPEVGRSIQGSATDWPPTPEEIDRVGIFGRGVLYIEQLNLSPPERGHRASILEIHFYCTVSLPRLSANFPMPNTYQDGPANGSQPLRSETNGPSSAPGSRR